uniref:Uncharacterized protein n=1 Tax=Cacopsylla melanoneura TaxID=428564 RepID=A0A8D8W9R4_9HEMI
MVPIVPGWGRTEEEWLKWIYRQQVIFPLTLRTSHLTSSTIQSPTSTWQHCTPTIHSSVLNPLSLNLTTLQIIPGFIFRLSLGTLNDLWSVSTIVSLTLFTPAT